MGMQKRNFSLAGTIIPRAQPRQVDQRSEERIEGLIDRAIVTFREQEYLVPVLNISSRGTMIESGIMPRIGEAVVVQFENCARMQAFVRWVREGRVGLNFGHEIVLG
jgi:hypothetical protein